MKNYNNHDFPPHNSKNNSKFNMNKYIRFPKLKINNKINNNQNNIKFWLEKPADLFVGSKVLPDQDDDFAEKLNSLTKLIIIVTIILAIFGWKYWLWFLVISLLLVLGLYMLHQNSQSNEFPSNDSSEVPTEKSNTTKNKSNKKDLIENFHEDMNNFTYYSNEILPKPQKETQEKQENQNKLNLTLSNLTMSKIRNEEIKDNYIKVPMSGRCNSNINQEIQRQPKVAPHPRYANDTVAEPIVIKEEDTTHKLNQPRKIIRKDNTKLEFPKTIVPNKKQQINFNPIKNFVPSGKHKSAYELSKEAYEPNDKIDHTELDRVNMMHGLV